MRLPPALIPRLLALTGVIVVAAVAVLATQPDAGATNTQAAAPAALLLVPADVITVDSGSVAQGVRVTGTLEPLNRTTINARVGAVIDSVPVREGERVRRGQVLLRQNSADAAAQLQQAVALLDTAKTELQLTEAYEVRKKTLHDQKYLSDVDFATAQGETEVRKATVKLREAGVAIARKALADTAVTAPIDGIVAERFVQPGTNVMPGQALLTLVDLSELELAANIPARDIPLVRIGASVDFSVDSYPGRTFRGKVVRINPMANGGARTITLYARVANADGTLKGGMFASGHVITGDDSKANVLRIPQAAVRQVDGKQLAWVIREDKLALQPLQLGVRDTGSGLVEVKQGLAAGERVILTAIGNRAAGTPVSVADAR